MYESPIEAIQTEIKTLFEDDCLKAVQSYGFIVNKEELIKALIYDRKQYDKGYSDGYNKAIDDFVEKVKLKYIGVHPDELYEKYYPREICEKIKELAEQLKARGVKK